MRTVLGYGGLVAALVLALGACGDDDVNCDGNEEVDGKCVITAPTTSASPEGGAYRALPSVVTLTADEPADIYYTTDGTDPTLESPRATSPVAVAIDGDTELRYFAVDLGGNEEEVKTSAYELDATRPAALTSFSAEADGDAVEVTWNAPSGTTVVIARIDSDLPAPEDGEFYDDGDDLPGGGEVIYAGTGDSVDDDMTAPGYARYAGWAVDAAGNYSEMATSDLTTAIPAQTASISIAINGTGDAPVTISTAPSLHDLAGTATYDAGTDTVTLDLTMTNRSSRILFAPKLAITNLSEGAFANADGSVDGDDFKRAGDDAAAPDEDAVATAISFTGVTTDPSTLTFDVEILDNRIVLGHLWNVSDVVAAIADTATLDQFTTVVGGFLNHGPSGGMAGRSGAISRDGRFAYLGSRHASAVAVLDLTTNEFVEYIPMPMISGVKGNVLSVSLSASGQFLHVLVADGFHAYADGGDQFQARAHVVKYDLGQRAVVGHVAIDEADFNPDSGNIQLGPNGLAVSHDGRKGAFVFTDFDTELSHLYVVDLETSEVAMMVDLSDTVCGNRVAWSADDETLMVAAQGNNQCWSDDTVFAKIDVGSFDITTANLGVNIKTMLADEDGTMWIGTDTGLMHYDPSDDSLSAAIGSSSQCNGLLMGDDGVALCGSYGDLRAIDTAMDSVLDSGSSGDTWYGNALVPSPF